MIDAQIENYRIIAKIGDGGMGSVYKAVDVMLEREVALKFLRPELAQQKDLVDRFRSEAIILAKLSHQNIASLYGLHRHGDDLFMAMEYVPGDTLEALLARDRTLPLERAVAIAGDVLEALDYAHKRGVVHRDVKTANVIVPPVGGVKVMDFGIARVLGTERHTRVGFVVGTIGYMAPEQIQGLDVDGRTDIYALGVVLYEMLTGRLPFQGETEYALMQAQIQQMPVPPRAFAPVPIPVENTILRSLAKLPHERFQTATEFHLALEAAVRQSAMYPAATAPFSSSGDETREFKSDPQLMAFPMPSSGVVPVFTPPASGAHPPLPATQPYLVAPPPLPPTSPALTPPPVSEAAAPKPPLTPTEPAVPVVSARPGDVASGVGLPPLPAGPASASQPSGQVPSSAFDAPAPAATGEAFDPDATIRLGSSPWRVRPDAAGGGARSAWDQPTVLTPIPGPPPSPPGPEVAAPPPSTGETPSVSAGAPATGPRVTMPPPPPLPLPVAAPLGTTEMPARPAPLDVRLPRSTAAPGLPAVVPVDPRRPDTVPPTPVVPVVTAAAAAIGQMRPVTTPGPAEPAVPVVAAAPPAAGARPVAAVKATATPAAAPKKGGSTGLVLAAAAVIVLGALAVLGIVVWQRWQSSSTEQVADGGTTTTVLESAPAQDLAPAVDPGVASVAPAVPQAPVAPTPKAAPKTTTTVPAARKQEPSFEPLPSPVPPTVVTPQLAPASPEVQAKPAAPPVMFGGVKWMQVDGSHVKEIDAFLQLGDNEIRVLDDRVRTSLARVPFSAISHVVYSSGKRPGWRKDIGPVPIESAFDTTVRTFHYIAFQGGSQFLLVRVKDDDLPRLRDELKKRASLGVETAR